MFLLFLTPTYSSLVQTIRFKTAANGGWVEYLKHTLRFIIVIFRVGATVIKLFSI